MNIPAITFTGTSSILPGDGKLDVGSADSTIEPIWGQYLENCFIE